MDNNINSRLKSLPEALLGELRGVYKTQNQALLIPAEPVDKGRPRFIRNFLFQTGYPVIIHPETHRTATDSYQIGNAGIGHIELFGPSGYPVNPAFTFGGHFSLHNDEPLF